MILDGHIHLRRGPVDREAFLCRLRAGGIDGGAVFSFPPSCFRGPDDPAERLDHLLACTGGHPNLFPFFWVDPVEADAADQVARAADRGVAGFKIICGRHEVGDARALPVYRRIAETGRPVLFHSGILWDGEPSGDFCRPCRFEVLLEIDGLRFALAHLSWPWVDECIAVYGKFLNAYSRRPDLSVEMFIDVTPGTPPVYRREALGRLFTVGYDVENNVLFGLDSCANDYNVAWAKEWLDRDRGIYADLGLSGEVQEKVFGGNLLRFVGASEARIEHRAPRPGES